MTENKTTFEEDAKWWASPYNKTEDSLWPSDYVAGKTTNTEAMTQLAHEVGEVLTDRQLKTAVEIGKIGTLTLMTRRCLRIMELPCAAAPEQVPESLIKQPKKTQNENEEEGPWTFIQQVIIYHPEIQLFERQCRYTAYGNCPQCWACIPLGCICYRHNRRSCQVFFVREDPYDRGLPEAADWPTEANELRKFLDQPPAHPARLADLTEKYGVLILDNDWFHPCNDTSQYDPNYQGCEVNEVHPVIQNWIDDMENPKRITNAYLEDNLRRIFRCNVITVRQAVDGIILSLNQRLQEEIKRNRLVEDSEYQSSGIEYEITDDVVDRQSHDLVNGPMDRRCYPKDNELEE